MYTAQCIYCIALLLFLLFLFLPSISPVYDAMQVNGVDVVSLKVSEVEDMIQECSHITLTLLGKLAPNGTRGEYHNVQVNFLHEQMPPKWC